MATNVADSTAKETFDPPLPAPIVDERGGAGVTTPSAAATSPDGIGTFEDLVRRARGGQPSNPGAMLLFAGLPALVAALFVIAGLVVGLRERPLGDGSAAGDVGPPARDTSPAPDETHPAPTRAPARARVAAPSNAPTAADERILP